MTKNHERHQASAAHLEVRRAKNRMKTRARDGPGRPAQIFAHELVNLEDEVSALIISEATKRAIRRYQVSHRPPVPNDANELELPQLWQQTLSGEVWFSRGIDDEGRAFFMFATPLSLTDLNGKRWFIDGTFGVVPPQFRQLLTILVSTRYVSLVCGQLQSIVGFAG